jgi:hypothetical protein
LGGAQCGYKLGCVLEEKCVEQFGSLLCCKTDMLVLALYANGLGSNPFYSKKSTEWWCS